MDRSISGGDLIGRWSLSFADIDFVNSKPALTRLGLAAQLKFFASLGFSRPILAQSLPIRTSRSSADARAFASFLAGPEAARIFRGHGWRVPATLKR
ncbi:hypothetical protein SAMN02927924_04645 [Sphingobium faniae]|nr:hypothetical protein SAMN02927924_04645 [Sphingobium faniae]